MSLLPRLVEGYEATADVVVVGAGAAGLVAGLAAREEGTDVVVLESCSVPRGSTALSAGLVPGAGTRFQREAGIDDEPGRLAADIARKAHGEPDPGLVRTVTDAVGPALEWLADTHGLPFSLVSGFRYPGHGVDRMHGLPSRSGRELVDRLAEAALRSGLDLVCDARTASLHADRDGRIAGVGIERPDGSTETLGCRALVLACGGYGGDATLVAAHVPCMAGALYFGHPEHRGDALRWGEALGAATAHLSGHQGHGSVAQPSGILVTWATMTEGGVQVNQDGDRFSDESRGYSEQAASVLAQPDGIAWSLFDERIAAVARQFDDFNEAERVGAILSGGSWVELAARMRVPAAKLAATMATVSRLKAGLGTDSHGRSFAGLRDLVPPFRAARVTGALFHTQGGLIVDGAARVRRRDGSSFPNLFAAGGAAAGVSGGRAGGYLSGNGLMTAVALGRLAGAAAARAARTGDEPARA